MSCSKPCAVFFLIYMLPRRLFSSRLSPFNPNGKIDCKALVRMLDENVLT